MIVNKKLKKKILKKRKIILVTLIILLLIFFLFKLKDEVLKKLYPIEYSEYVYKYSEENNIDPLLVFSIIKAESNFKRSATSNSGAIGLMQLMPETAKEMLEIIGDDYVIKEQLYNPEQNIKIGTKYYAYLLKRYNNKELALAAYNAGIGNVDDWISQGIIKRDGSDLENIPYKETNNYVRKILRNYRIYQYLYGKQ